MVYAVKSSRGCAKLVDNGNYIYRLDRKYGEKTYWKCEVKQSKARVHTTHKDDTLSICAAFDDHCHSSNPINGVCSGRVRQKLPCGENSVRPIFLRRIFLRPNFLRRIFLWRKFLELNNIFIKSTGLCQFSQNLPL